MGASGIFRARGDVLSEFSSHHRDARFAEGRAAVVLAALSVLCIAVSAGGAAIVALAAWH